MCMVYKQVMVQTPETHCRILSIYTITYMGSIQNKQVVSCYIRRRKSRLGVYLHLFGYNSMCTQCKIGKAHRPLPHIKSGSCTVHEFVILGPHMTVYMWSHQLLHVSTCTLTDPSWHRYPLKMVRHTILQLTWKLHDKMYFLSTLSTAVHKELFHKSTQFCPLTLH